MLKARIITAVVLLFVFITVLFFLPFAAWVGFATLIALLAAWEWGGLMGGGETTRCWLALALCAICLSALVAAPSLLGLADDGASLDLLWRLGRWFYIPSAFFWLFVVPFWMAKRWVLPGNIVGVMVGAVLILPAWLAMLQLKLAGNGVLIAVMASVWIADSAAYFAGRRFGRRKLAPTISPGKTWEGAIGGALAVVVYGMVIGAWFFDIAPRHLAGFLLALLLLTALGIVGDLFESMLKRQSGLKDSSNVLPGHGGVLDRIDSLTSVLPLAALVWLLVYG